MISSLRLGSLVSDHDFDRIYPKSIQRLSRTHWTAVDVAACAAEWLAVKPGVRLLDVGAGVGKFCTIAALTTQAHVTGVEHDANLWSVARAVARLYQIERLKLILGDATTLDWTSFDGAYLYNPFAQAITLSRDRVSSAAVASTAYERQIDAVHARLGAARPGFRVAVYCGFGAALPSSFNLIAAERFGPGPLEIWEKCAAAGPAP